MTQDDVLFGYRLQLFALAAERGVSQACRLMGVHRSTYYRWKTQVERQGLEMLRPRERRRPLMPNQLSVLVEQRKPSEARVDHRDVKVVAASCAVDNLDALGVRERAFEQ